MDSAGSDGPHRRTAFVGRELCRYGMEMRLALQRKGRSKKLALAIYSFGVDVK